MLRDCEIITSRQIADRIFTLTIDAGELARQARPGQFIHIKCGDELQLRRPISICDKSEDFLKVVFKVAGEGTDWLSQKKSGTLNVLGPLGNGFDVSGRNILVVGGGIGVPPLLLAAKSAVGMVSGILGFADMDQVILEKEFRHVCEKVYITTDDGSYKDKGFVTSPLKKCLESGAFDTVLACGPRAMLKAVSGLASDYNVSCQVSMEERMGCGVGACLVCACKKRENGAEYYAHVCKDGPVFNAEEVVWDE